MLTTNFKKILTRAIFNSSASGPDGYPSISEAFTMTGASGTEITATAGSSTMIALINVFNNPYTTSSGDSAYNKIFCRLGTGTTPPTEDDYWLEAQDDNLTCSSAVAFETDSNTKVYTFTFNNPTNTDITITETALGIKLDGNVLSENASLMLDRTVLSTPITIPAGESKAITYELGF
jgi:hypothetical protein